jgi:hypothetical protein
MLQAFLKIFVCSGRVPDPTSLLTPDLFLYAAGLVKAARLEASYPDGTELKIVVHHRGCPDPVNFTASVLSELDQVVAKVLVGESV